MKKAGWLFVLIFIFFPACKKTSLSDIQVHRLIDHLKKENIEKSPFLSRALSSLVEAHFPVDSYPLLDLGSGENSLKLKRKMNLGIIEINTIFSPPASTYSFDFIFSGQAVLDFGIGIIRDINYENLHVPAENEQKGVEFIIILERGGRKKTIFQKYLEIPPRREERTLNFSLNKVELPAIRQKARIILMTSGGHGLFSFWYNPVIYHKEKKGKNVILISVDTLRADHLGCYGYQRETSPNIDALAQDSALFLNTYASSAWTLPSHISLLTSLFNVNHQVYYSDDKIDPGLITTADVLRQNNFSCSAITGGAYVSSRYGFSKGFDSYGEGQGDMFFLNSAELTFQAVSEWLDQNKDKNFFLFIHTYQPHNPYDCPPPFNSLFCDRNSKQKKIDIIEYLGGRTGIFKPLSKEERQNIIGLYDGEIRYTDEKFINPLIEKLKELKIYDPTMIILTSDHGEEFYDHGGWEHGHTLYDELLKVPLIIKFPSSKFKGKRIEPIVRLVDVMPTIFEEMGIDSAEFSLDGQSLIPILRGRAAQDRIFLADRRSHVTDSATSERIAMNRKKMKIIINKEFPKEELKFYLFPPPLTPSLELYNLEKDHLEKNNCSLENSQLVRELVQQVEEIYKNVKRRKVGKIRMSRELEEQLRALGYVR